MVYGLHLSINGEPIGMYIEQAHKDADHQTLVVEILCLFYFLNDHHFAIGGSHYDTLCVISGKIANGTAEEIQHDTIYNGSNTHKAPKGDFGVK
jgi:hypothetical protein